MLVCQNLLKKNIYYVLDYISNKYIVCILHLFFKNVIKNNY